MIYIKKFIHFIYKFEHISDTKAYFNEIVTVGIASTLFTLKMALASILAFFFVNVLLRLYGLWPILRIILLALCLYCSFLYIKSFSRKINSVDHHRRFQMQCNFFIIIIAIQATLLCILLWIITKAYKSGVLCGILIAFYFTVSILGLPFMFRSFYLSVYMQMLAYILMGITMPLANLIFLLKQFPICLLLSSVLLASINQNEISSLNTFLAHQALKKEHQKYTLFLENTSNAIALLSIKGRKQDIKVEYWNSVWSKEPLMVNSEQDLKHQLSVHCIKKVGTILDAIYCLTSNMKESHTKKEMHNIEIERGDKTYYYRVDLTIVCQDHIQLIFVQYTDNTLAISLEQQKFKHKILCSISHELLNPMNSIISVADKLTTLNETNRCYSILYVNANLLFLKIKDFICFTEIESKHVLIRKANYKIRDIIAKVLHLYREELNSKALVTTLNVHQPMPDTVYTDDIRIMQVLSNLMSNAIKFTPQHGKIGITLQCHENDPTIVQIIVQDTGEGIDAYKFNQGKLAGLGLYISKYICSALDTCLNVLSILNEGSKFWFELPSNILDNTINVPKEIQNIKDFKLKHIRRNSFDSNNCIIIVDDSYFNRMTLKIMVSKILNGVIVYEATNGVESVLKFTEVSNKFKNIIIFMDIDMPIMDGPTATQSIIQKNKTTKAEVDIIGVTAFSSEKEINCALKAGMREVYTKPLCMQKIKDYFCSIGFAL